MYLLKLFLLYKSFERIKIEKGRFVMAKIRILIVEDEILVAKDIQNMLEISGYEVVGFASTGENALDMVKKKSPDLVFMDIALKGPLDGIQVSEIIRKDFYLPVIYLTALSDETTLQRAKITEPFGYILKPFNQKELRAAIEMALYKHQMEKKTKESEEKYRNLFENAVEGIYQSTPQGRFLSANPALARILGFDSPQELITSLTNIEKQHYVHPRERAELRRKLAKEGEVSNFEYEAHRKDGRAVWLSESVRIVRDPAGKILYYEGMIQDITVRKKAEEELKNSQNKLKQLTAHLESLREEERTKMAREIHDELGQALTGLKFDLNWVHKNLSLNKDVLPQLEEKIQTMSQIVDSTIVWARRMISELRPSVLDDLGLVDAIEWLVKDYQERTGLLCTFIPPQGEVFLDQERSTALFRICQEGLTNVVRHAKATSATISLRKIGSDLILEIQDNGKGIQEKDVSSTKTFGILGMKERAILLGGEISFRGIPRKGTIVTVRLPMAQPQPRRE